MQDCLPANASRRLGSGHGSCSLGRRLQGFFAVRARLPRVRDTGQDAGPPAIEGQTMRGEQKRMPGTPSAEDLSFPINEFQKISLSQAMEWLQEGRPRSGERAVVVDAKGREVAMLVNPQEYRAVVAALEVQGDPTRLALIRERMRQGQSLDSKPVTPNTNIFDRRR